MIRFHKNVWVFFLLMMIVILIYPSQIVCKTNRVSKTPKTSQKAKTPEKIKTTQNEQAPSGSLQYDAKSAVLMDGLTGQILYEQNSDLRISPATFAKVMTLYLVSDAIRAGQLNTGDL